MIVYACSDLIFATRIGSTAEALGIVTRPTRDADKLAARLDRVEDGKANDPVDAVLVDLDLGDAGIALIRQAVEHPSEPVVIAFGAHVATELLQQAAEAGAKVMTRGSFTGQLPQLLQHLDGPTKTA